MKKMFLILLLLAISITSILVAWLLYVVMFVNMSSIAAADCVSWNLNRDYIKVINYDKQEK